MMSRTDGVRLRPVTRENVRAICELRLRDDQHHLVAPAAFTVAEGHYEPGAILRAIYQHDEPVGVLLVEVETGTPYLVRFMIDAAHQGQGTGRRAVDLLERELRSSGWKTLETTFNPTDGGAEGFWRCCGFRDTGRQLHGEPVFTREL
jgi:diamine N-acetyltransferase